MKQERFSFAPICILFLPSAGISYLCERSDVWMAGVIAVCAMTSLCILLFIIRNFAEIVGGMLGALLLIALLSACACIPVIGWIADVLIFLYALMSIWASISALLPYALKGVLLLAAFLLVLLPDVFHPVISPFFVFLVALGLGAAVAKKISPLDEFILMIASIPLLAVAILSLGRLFQSGVTIRGMQFKQNVSGYTTRSGGQVGDYTRIVTKAVPVVSTSVSPGAAAFGNATGVAAKEELDQ